MGSFTKLKRILEEKERFVLVYHIEPDGDAIGSAFALSEYLENQGKKVFLVGRDQIPSAFSFLETKYTILSELPHEDYEVIVLLDNGDAKRTGFPQEIMEQKAQGKIVVNIDHHSRNDLWRMVSVNYADETASSTSEIIYRVLIGLKAEMSRSIATNLLAGIYNDTGGFKHSNTTEQVLAIVADLLKRGGQLNKIAEKVENSRPVSLFKLWGIALLRLHYSLEWQVS
ncbi:MAG: DHH family phosphoesterase, partial [Candidatus Berkelbacteria bacterium]|nr:DHH family phosphoesterase [Candidatus Berkelbacteria bacterium]